MQDLQHKLYFDNLLSNRLKGVAYHQMVFDNNGNTIDYIISEVNMEFESIFGYTKKESEGKLASELYGDVLSLDMCSDVILNKNSKYFEFYHDKINKYFGVSVAYWNDIGFIAIFTDITDRINVHKNLDQELIFQNEENGKSADELIIANEEKVKSADELINANDEKYKRSEELIKSESRLERAEIISKTGNWELYVDKKIINVSVGVKKIYELKTLSNEFKYQDIKNFTLPEYREYLDNSLSKLIENNKHYNVEFKINVNNKIKIIKSIANYDDRNRVVFGVIQDITSQKENEEALEKSNSIKNTFLSNISHELRTPMNTIIGFSDILLNDSKNKGSYRFLKSINSNAKHLDELLNNILDYSKIESEALDILYEQFSVLDLFEELSDIFEEVNYSKNLNFVKLLFLKCDDIKISSDYLRVKQVLYNMISNSIKFTDKGYIKVSFSLKNNYITFKVEDTGIGISEENVPHVFDRFWQCDSSSRKKYKGTGLGLSISQSIVKILNGDIWLTSVLNKGTTFFIKIPIEEIVKEKNNDDIDFSDKTVLIIDDIPPKYSILGIYLTYMNINMITANCGDEAVEIYKQQKEKIDIIIIDLNLFCIKSYDMIKNIKMICGDCKIISKSGVDEEKNNLVDYHLKKPINKDKLITILKSIWQK
jgi:signal transduction histidine kinase/CheY-like chemotaxis protein